MSTAGPTLDLGPDTWLLVLTGAGVSAESGIPTFRAAGGLWEDHRVEDVASLDGFTRDPALVWRFYSQRRANVAGAAPNPGHRALAAVEARLGDRFLLATQNVDGLHAAAGSYRVVELHGNLFRSRCALCTRPSFEDRDVYPDNHVPGCARCHARGDFGVLRPHIVWFGEALAPADLERVEAFMREAAHHRFVFLAAGTSGLVRPASTFVERAAALGAETWLVNAEPPANATAFGRSVIGPSGAVLPALLGTR